MPARKLIPAFVDANEDVVSYIDDLLLLNVGQIHFLESFLVGPDFVVLDLHAALQLIVLVFAKELAGTGGTSMNPCFWIKTRK